MVGKQVFLASWLILLSYFINQIFITLNASENQDSINPDLFEGDMILEPGQRLAAEFGLDLDGLNRGSVRNRQWPNGIVPYNIHSSLGNDRST